MKLPLNCEAAYFEDFLDPTEAKALFTELNSVMQSIKYAPRTIDGKTYEVNFGKVMFIDQNLHEGNRFPEAYWGPTKVWFSNLKKLRERIEDFTGHRFQVCVAIYYPDGNSGVDFHSDYPAFGDTSIIPSISLGEQRLFKFREKESGEELSLQLPNGSLVVMGKHCQERYEHCLPVDPVYKNPRINLTFRKYGYDD